MCLDTAQWESTLKFFSFPFLWLFCGSWISLPEFVLCWFKESVELVVIVFIVKFSVCAHSHGGSNCDREIVGWLLCRGCLGLFAMWNKCNSESEGKNCGWRDDQAGVLLTWLTVTCWIRGLGEGAWRTLDSGCSSYLWAGCNSDAVICCYHHDRSPRQLCLTGQLSHIWTQLKPPDMWLRQTGTSCLKF